MKNSFYSLLIASVMTFGALCAQGAEATAQAVVLTVQGPVSVTVAGGDTTLIKAGERLPQGAVIKSEAGGQADIQVFNGAVATIRPDTTVILEKLSVTASGGVVTKQTALLNLKVGSIASNIDPANHNINDYGIRTPKGVAAARGTSYTVNVTANGQTQVFVSQSAITFTVTTIVNGQPVVSSQIVPANSQITVSPTGEISVIKLKGSDLQEAKDNSKPVDEKNAPNVTVTGKNDNNDNNANQGNNPPPLLILDPVSPSS